MGMFGKDTAVGTCKILHPENPGVLEGWNDIGIVEPAVDDRHGDSTASQTPGMKRVEAKLGDLLLRHAVIMGGGDGVGHNFMPALCGVVQTDTVGRGVDQEDVGDKRERAEGVDEKRIVDFDLDGIVPLRTIENPCPRLTDGFEILWGNRQVVGVDGKAHTPPPLDALRREECLGVTDAVWRAAFVLQRQAVTVGGGKRDLGCTLGHDRGRCSKEEQKEE